MSELDNLGQPEIDTTRPFEDDTGTEFSAADLDFEDNGADEALQAEPNEASEQDVAEDDESAKAKQEAAPKADEPKITFPDGTELPQKEVIAGYMKDADYRQKTATLAEGRRAVEVAAGNITQTATRLAEIMAQMMPQAPDPQLAFSDPQEHYRQQFAYENAAKTVNDMLALATGAKGSTDAISQSVQAEAVKREGDALHEAHPELSDPAKKEAFFQGVFEAAIHFGFQPEEVAQSVDHRLYRLAHYAGLALKAEAAQTKAKQAVAKAPPIVKPRANVAPSSAEEAARRRFAQTGSLEDAMALNFD